MSLCVGTVEAFPQTNKILENLANCFFLCIIDGLFIRSCAIRDSEQILLKTEFKRGVVLGSVERIITAECMGLCFRPPGFYLW